MKFKKYMIVLILFLMSNALIAQPNRTTSTNTAAACNTNNSPMRGNAQIQATQCDYDCLSGDGSVRRTNLTFNTLQTTGNGKLMDLSAFTIPSCAANPVNSFEGTLQFTAAELGWSSVKDPFNYGAISNAKKLPDFNYKFIQHGTHLIPVDRGLQITNHNLWQLILEPGRVWNEKNDNGFSRASLPFALQESGANCTHNGVMSFLFKSDGSMSSVAYEIVSETCQYHQFNLHGLLAANFIPSANNSAVKIKSDYEIEVANRMTIKPLSDLAVDYPTSGINVNTIASEQTTNSISAFGVAYNNVHYTGNCDTRYGPYPYCDVLSLPSYSLAKSIFTGYGLMALEQAYPGIKYDPIGSYVSECPGSRWNDVTLENALDMATGNYTDPGFQIDENSDATLYDFFLVYTDTEKSNYSCSYLRQTSPGTRWVYHTSDSYLISKSMDQYLGQDSYSWLVNTIYKPIGISPVMNQSVRTFDFANQTFGGYGLTYHRDDIIKLAELINNDAGKINGKQMLDTTMVTEVLQQSNYHGLNTGINNNSYDNGFWIWKADTTLACASDLYIPYMSGYGGITIALLPNNMVYYVVSDNNEFSFRNTTKELDKIANFCN